MSQHSDATFEAISQLIRKHLEERDWLNNPSRGLAISIALEASELLEHYQWQDEAIGDKQALAEELADILIYAFQFAIKNDIDIPAAIQQKLKKSAEKYPAELFKGKSKEEMTSIWLDAKLHHKKEGL